MSYGTPPPPPPQWGDQQPAYGGLPQPHPKGTMILVFGIIGLVCCMPFGIASWVMGNNALKEIDARPGAYSNRGTVQAGKILGIIAVVLTVVGIIGYAILIAIVASNGGFETSP
ncbi:MAG: DUF4190 domain-containing protein [Nocardioides sp.]|uniref:DUF4190 domain-containing protein n=1 Tax=Nocardioides sp. TaxID=35761 RepID=UPI0039E4D3ED